MALPLLVGEVAVGRAAMRPVGQVDAAFVMGWRSSTEVVVGVPADRDSNLDGQADVLRLSVVDVVGPGPSVRDPLLEVRATGLPRFAGGAWTADVVPAPDVPFAPDPRLVCGGAAGLVLLLVVGWRGTRSRRGHP